MKNLANPAVIKEILKQNSFNFSKSLGQNFLIDEGILTDITQSADTEGANILEIGPGFGTLTQRLCQNAKKVVSVEIDSSAIPILKENLREFNNLKIIHADIMKTDIAHLLREEFGTEEVKVCANLPYYITSPAITALLNPGLNISSVTVMIQKEVAQRINALPSSKDYGFLTLSVGYRAVSEIITYAPPSSFMPPPKVTSAVIRLTIRKTPPVALKDEELYFKIIKASFAKRRKTLLNTLSSGLKLPKDEILDALQNAGIDPARRGETLSQEEFADIANQICQKE